LTGEGAYRSPLRTIVGREPTVGPLLARGGLSRAVSPIIT
jgi:hypothetical protein